MWFRALSTASVALGLGAAAIIAACGDTYEEASAQEDGGSASTSGSSGAPGDGGASVPPDGAAATGPRCDARKPFSKVERVPGLPDGAACARLSPDESIITFCYDQESRVATRGADGNFGPATAIPLDSKAIWLTSSADRRRVYYEDYFTVLQQTGEPGGPYGAKQNISSKGTVGGIGHPYYDEPHNQLYVDFHLVANYFQNVAIGVATITGGTTSEFRRVDVGFGVTGGETEQVDASEPASYYFSGATPSVDGLVMYFGTTRTSVDNEKVGDLNVWVATRTSTEEPFTRPERVDSINTKDGEMPTWLSPDNCRLYFHSNRDDPNVYANSTYVATRDP